MTILLIAKVYFPDSNSTELGLWILQDPLWIYRLIPWISDWSGVWGGIGGCLMKSLSRLGAGALTREGSGTFDTGPKNFYRTRIIENVARGVNNKLGLSFLFFLLTNAWPIFVIWWRMFSSFWPQKLCLNNPFQKFWAPRNTSWPRGQEHKIWFLQLLQHMTS